MPKHKKIDKKQAVTFQLVHRSQQDPLIADETAPQRVLLPVVDGGKESRKEKEKRLEVQQEHGVHYDDDTNYLESLKDRKDNVMQWPAHVEKELTSRREKTKAKLPPTVFASEQEEEVGLLAKAAPVYGPQLHLDPDLVAAMDDDFDYSDPENQLEDNFMELADGVASDGEFNKQDELDDDDDDVGSLGGSERSFQFEETKSKFTNYSMTSSVMRRNEQLTLLDERFEKMYDDYQECEIGPLDCEEIEGYIPHSSEIFLQYAEEFEKSQKREQLGDNPDAEKVEKQLEAESDSDKEDMVYMEVPDKEKWDCESILSTYSNLYNHPKLITEPKVNQRGKITLDKKGIPKNVLGSDTLTVEGLRRFNEGRFGHNGDDAESITGRSVVSQLSALSIRPNNESPEQKRERKKMLKEYRRERRLEKKLNVIAFKEEAKRQSKILINNRNNVQGNKIL